MNVVLNQERYHQKCHNIQDFDHRVDGRTCGILVRIADRVAGHRGLVAVGLLLVDNAFVVGHPVVK